MIRQYMANALIIRTERRCMCQTSKSKYVCSICYSCQVCVCDILVSACQPSSPMVLTQSTADYSQQVWISAVTSNINLCHYLCIYSAGKLRERWEHVYFSINVFKHLTQQLNKWLINQWYKICIIYNMNLINN